MNSTRKIFSFSQLPGEEKDKQALLDSIRESGKKGMAKINSFVVPPIPGYDSPKTPLFLTPENTFFSTELTRVVQMKHVEEYWAIMGNLRRLFAEKETITSIDQFTLIQEKQSHIVETQVIESSVLSVVRAKIAHLKDKEQRTLAVQDIEQILLQKQITNIETAKLATAAQQQSTIQESSPTQQSHRPSELARIFNPNSSLKLSSWKTTQTELKRPSTSSNNRLRADSASRKSIPRVRSQSQSSETGPSGQIGYNLSLISIVDESPAHSPQHSRQHSVSSSERMRANTALGKMTDSAPPTPMAREPSYKRYFTEPGSTELLNFSSQLKAELLDLLLKDKLLTADFEFKLIDELEPLLAKFFFDLRMNDSAHFDLLCKAEERDAEYLAVKTGLDNFIGLHQSSTNKIMTSAINQARNMCDRLSGLKKLYVTESEKLSADNAKAFNNFDQELIKLYSEIEKALHKTHRFHPFAASETIKKPIEDLRSFIKSFLTPKLAKKTKPLPQQQNGLFGKKSSPSNKAVVQKAVAASSAPTKTR